MLAPAPPGAPPLTILFADHDPELMAAVRPHLEGCGWRVVYAADGEEALRLAGDGFDLAVVEMTLPRLSGFRLADCLRARFGPRVPVVMLSDFDAAEHRDYATQVGVSHFLGKPFALDHLLALIAAGLP